MHVYNHGSQNRDLTQDQQKYGS